MNTRKKRLGRGLDALLSSPAESGAPAPMVPGRDDGLRTLPLDLLQRGQYQPRIDMRQESLEELAASIRAQGVVQPIVVRPLDGDGPARRYEIIAGERRWRAAQMAGLEEIPAVVREASDEDAIAMALIENIQREDLNPLEESHALDRLIREFGLTHQETADAVGRSRAAVSNLLRLQELSARVKPLLEQRQLDMGHARALLSIGDPVQQYDLARQVVKKGLSVRATERLVKSVLDPTKRATKSKAAPANDDADIRRLETDVSERLGARVRLEHSVKGYGKLVISYNSLDELDGILKHIR
jgi:ParB family chromosome partitioning protein